MNTKDLEKVLDDIEKEDSMNKLLAKKSMSNEELEAYVKRLSNDVLELGSKVKQLGSIVAAIVGVLESGGKKDDK